MARKNSGNPGFAHFIRFGIPSLDRLVDPLNFATYKPCDLNFGFQYGADENEATQAVSCCLIGPEGTGKSVFAMHLASHYLFTTPASREVIYLSTDLNHQKAEAIFKNFALDRPNKRQYDPFDERFSKWHSPSKATRLRLRRVEPNDVVKFIVPEVGTADHSRDSLLFLDLARNTVGDDWGYINRLVASLPMPRIGDPLHLMVVDAVEGLEILVGNTDAFGQKRDQRSKIAQLLRTAIQKCHIVFVNEEADATKLSPTEFVSDLVIRLGFLVEQNYSRRVLEVLKSRGQTHLRGLHDFSIRSGRGSTTGLQQNPDDPKVSIKNKAQSYVYVFPSIHAVSRQLMEEEGRAITANSKIRFGFGVKYLDTMLDGQTQQQRRKNIAEFERTVNDNKEFPGDPLGFLGPKPIALIGEHQTFKSRLSRAFLSRAFQHNNKSGVAVLLTTKAIDSVELARKLLRHNGLNPDAIENHGEFARYQENIICRRLEIHHISPSVFLHIVNQMIRQAQRILKSNSVDMSSEKKRREQGWRIRFVVDDWTAIKAMYPELISEQKLLPAVTTALLKEGIASVFKGNEVYGFKGGVTSRCTQLSDLAAIQISTWRVHFFGESRIAIGVNPPGLEEGRNDAIRELRSVEFTSRPPIDPLTNKTAFRRIENAVLSVNPFFELYKGVREGNPKHVKLIVRLFSERDSKIKGGPNPVDEKPASVLENSICEYFLDAEQLFTKLLGSPDLIEFDVEHAGSYGRLREFSELQGISRYDETVVLQVDEFWSKPGPMTLKNQIDYLFDETCSPSRQPDRLEDPFRFFQPTLHEPISGVWNRASCFSLLGFDLNKHRANFEKTIAKVPYYWDFGFLSFDSAIIDDLPQKLSPPAGRSFDALVKYHRELKDCGNDTARYKQFFQSLTWFEFAEMCAGFEQYRDGASAPVCDPDLIVFAPYYGGAENCPALALEILASEIASDCADQDLVADYFPSCRHDEEKKTLADIISENKFSFLKSVLLMSAMIDNNCMDGLNRKPWFKWDEHSFLFSRHWYSTACRWQSDRVKKEQDKSKYDYCGLPGLYTTRGDWYLAITKGSRSYRMGERAIDVLCSRRSNIVRLQNGMGLPVRGSSIPTEAELWTFLQTVDEPDDDIMPGNRKYAEILSWGPQTKFDRPKMREKNSIGRPGFNWLWRSRIKLYERHSRVWRRWLLAFLNATKNQPASALLNEYKDLDRNSQSIPITDFPKGKWVNDLISTLEKATLE